MPNQHSGPDPESTYIPRLKQQVLLTSYPSRPDPSHYLLILNNGCPKIPVYDLQKRKLNIRQFVKRRRDTPISAQERRSEPRKGFITSYG